MKSALVLALVLSGCLRQTSYHCTSTTECGAGTCEQPAGFCAFPDSTCATGSRFGELSGSYAGQCVSGSAIDAAIDSQAGTFTIGGTVTGLTGTGLVLRDNGGDDRAITASGAFTFATALATGATYAVTVKTQPSGQICNLAGATGTVASAPVTSVMVTCHSPVVDPGIECGGSACTVGTQMCCHGVSDTTGTCTLTTNTCAGGTAAMTCDDAADCGGGANVCCTHLTNMGALKQGACETSAGACVPVGMNDVAQILCDPLAASPCPGSLACVADATHGWHYCQ